MFSRRRIPRLYLVRHLVEHIDMLYSRTDLHKHAMGHSLSSEGSVVALRSASLGVPVQLVGDPEADDAESDHGENC